MSAELVDTVRIVVAFLAGVVLVQLLVCAWGDRRGEPGRVLGILALCTYTLLAAVDELRLAATDEPLVPFRLGLRVLALALCFAYLARRRAA